MTDDLNVKKLRERLQHGPIPFSDFMHHALYAPQCGYYSSNLEKLGAAGDFMTAPELTPLFGQTLSCQLSELLTVLKEPVVLEFGAGSGQLCVDLLLNLEKMNSLPEAYCILEVSPNLRQRQQALMAEKIPHLLSLVQWLSAWPESSFNGVVLANEVLDAMPVSRFLQTETDLFESHVALDEKGQLHELYLPCKNERLRSHVTALWSSNPCPYPYQSEVNLFIDGWLQQCYEVLHQGVLLLFDYGFPQHEYYHPDRNQGTLMCHYHHRAHTNPFIHIGEQDITAHVDFTHVATAASNAGFHVAGFTNQAAFLLANGLLQQLSAVPDGRSQFMAQQAVKQLIQPSEMGELFKVMALTKQFDSSIRGFELHDKRGSL